jgi:ribosome recycling factor
VAIRNVRRDIMHDLRDLKKEGEVGADEEHRAETELQKVTDARIGEIDSFLSGKEEEILEV